MRKAAESADKDRGDRAAAQAIQRMMKRITSRIMASQIEGICISCLLAAEDEGLIELRPQLRRILVLARSTSVLGEVLAK